MREVIVHPLPEITTEIREVDIPTPAPDQVVIRVVVAGSNVKGTISVFNFLTPRSRLSQPLP
jgi:NADPH:quinone reductase-like Zn-dependent oxidoreductase